MVKKQIATFLGPNQGLSISGEYAYCYTGNHPANTTSVEAMKFTTGDYSLVGTFQLNTAIQNADGPSTAVSIAQIEMNGGIISHIVASLAHSAAPQNTQLLVIPPNTEVIVRLYSNEDQSARFMTATLTGRIYR